MRGPEALGFRADLSFIERSNSLKWVLEAMLILPLRKLVVLCASARMLGISALGDISLGACLGSLGSSKPCFQILEGEELRSLCFLLGPGEWLGYDHGHS